MRNLKRLTILMVAMAPTLAPTVARGAGLTDGDRHPQPSLSLPAAGGSYVDPVFGTRIVRVTDSSDGAHCTHAYSYWNPFNSTSTRFMIRCDGVIRLYKWYPSSNQVVYDGTLTGPDGYKVQFGGATWSANPSYPNTIYALDQKGTRLWRINVAKRGKEGYTLLRDFKDKVPSSVYLDQLQVSEDGMSFTFHTRDRDDGQRREAYAWDRRTDTLYKFPRPSGYVPNETAIDKDGKRVKIHWQNDDQTFWTFRTGAKTWLYHEDPYDDASGHYDVGRDFIVNSGSLQPGLVVRTWSGLGSADPILVYRDRYGRLNWSIADHVSLRANPEEWVVASTYAGTGAWEPFEGEIYLARLDGGGFVRLAHHRSTGDEVSSSWRYLSEPRAAIDRSGRYIMFTSDHDTSRHDVFILKVPSAYWPG